MKKIFTLILALVMISAFAGCTVIKKTDDTNSAQTVTTDKADADSSNSKQVLFKSGTWASTTGSNYVFYEDGKGGKIINISENIGIGFEYEVTESGYVFHIGSADDNSTAQVEFSEYNGESNNRADIIWEDGKTEVIVFGSDRTDDEFSYEGRGDLILPED
ncbi:MAG: hypothetical protein II802_02205 [Clostridia bacterium]|nr:hypothetical protein [Clostridia bacterium]